MTRTLSKTTPKSPQDTPHKTMRAAALDRFGGVEGLDLKSLPVPEPGPDQVLIRVESAGLGRWDAAEREGVFARMSGTDPEFPYVLGSEGAGTVVAVGENVSRFHEGHAVYGVIMQRSPKGGFCAEYAALDADRTWPVPRGLSILQAGALPIDLATAWRGLKDVLQLTEDDTLLIFGAAGGIGHLALQLAKRVGARVFAVASGRDGVALCRRLGADEAVDGRGEGVTEAARDFAPGGIDAALLTAGGEAAERALKSVRDGGRVAYPHGVQPEPGGREGVRPEGYSASYDPGFMEELNRMIESGPFQVHVDRTFRLEEIAEAHRTLDDHYLGRIAVRPARI